MLTFCFGQTKMTITTGSLRVLMNVIVADNIPPSSCIRSLYKFKSPMSILHVANKNCFVQVFKRLYRLTCYRDKYLVSTHLWR